MTDTDLEGSTGASGAIPAAECSDSFACLPGDLDLPVIICVTALACFLVKFGLKTTGKSLIAKSLISMVKLVKNWLWYSAWYVG